MGLIDPENSNYGQGPLQIAEEVRLATDRRVEIEVYAGGKLGNERDMYEGSMLGTIAICTVANPVMSSFIPEMAILDQPFLFADTAEAHAAIDGRLGELIAGKAEMIVTVPWLSTFLLGNCETSSQS